MEEQQWTIAFGYAYGRMDAEDDNPNTSSQARARLFADHWKAVQNGSRPNMFDAWAQWLATSYTGPDEART